MFKTLFQCSPVPCAVMVRDKGVLHHNDAFAQLLGYRCNELNGRPLSLLLEKASVSVLNPDRENPAVRLRFKHKRGYPLELNCLMAPVNQSSAGDGVILQVTDIPVHAATAQTNNEPPSPTLADLAMDHIQEAVYLIGPGGFILDANKAACDTLGYPHEELVRLKVCDIDPDFNEADCASEPAGKPLHGSPIIDTHHRRKNGEVFPVRISTVIVNRDNQGYLLAFAMDVSEEQRLEDLRFNVLENLARGESLKSLQLIVDYTEALHPEAIASLMLVSDDGTHLLPGPANKLPRQYLEAIQQVPIGEGSGACGTAAATRKAVEVEDIARDPKFELCREAALEAGLHSCWSDPILGADGEVLGTFCIYLNTPGRPSEVGVNINARRASYYASIALERRRATRRIQESRQRYRDIFDNSLDALALLEVTDCRHFRTLEANPAMERMVDIRRDQMVGKLVEESAPPDVASRITEKFQACLESESVVEQELDLPVGRRTFHFTLIPVRGPEDRVHRIVVIARDITDQRTAESLLHTREQEFRALVENSPDGIIRYSHDGYICYTNPQARELMGDLADTSCGESNTIQFEDRIVPTDRQAYRNARNLVQETGTETRLVICVGANEKRNIRYQDVRFVPEFTPQGDVRSVLSVMRDITALKETETQLRTLVENSPNYIGRYLINGKLVYANPALLTWLGIDVHIARSQVNSKLSLPQKEAKSIQEAIQEAVLNERLVEREIYFSRIQEWHRILFVPEMNEQGEFTSVLTVGQDITRRRQIDQELRESRTLLRELGIRRESELEAERKRIAHEIHDELGQLLTTLRLNLSLTGTLLTPQDSVIRDKLSDMTQLVDRTIQTVRNIATSLRPAVLNAGIASALEWLTQEFSSHSGIQCQLTVPADIQLDEDRATVVFRMVQESLSNIGRHSGADRVWIHLHRHVTGYRLTVRDNGRGFDPDAVSSQQSFGLIGMQERVLSLNGQMQLNSAPGKGTSIEIIIPIYSNRKAS